MDETKDLVKKITEGIQEKKGRNIVIADLTNIEDTICKYFVICQGNSPSQVLAIVDSVKEYVRKTTGHKVYGIDGVLEILKGRKDIKYKEGVITDYLNQARALVRRMESDGFIYTGDRHQGGIQ